MMGLLALFYGKKKQTVLEEGVLSIISHDSSDIMVVNEVSILSIPDAPYGWTIYMWAIFWGKCLSIFQHHGVSGNEYKGIWDDSNSYPPEIL